MTETCTDAEIECVEEIFQRVASDLSMVADRDLTVLSVEAARQNERAIGADKIHISFRLAFQSPTGVQHGCMLIPLPDAVSLACCLMMVPGDVVKSNRSRTSLDSTTKDAMLEVGNFICGAADAALRALGASDVDVRFEGCQGVKPDVRPALIYEEGAPLIIGRAEVELADFSPDTLILILPELGCFG